MRKHYRNSQVQGEPNKQTFVSGDIKLCCLITIKTGNNIYLFITIYSLLRLHLVSRKIFTYFQWGVETNLAKIQSHNTVQGYNSEENPFKIILFLCFRRILDRSATFDSHPASSTWQFLDPTYWTASPVVPRRLLRAGLHGSWSPASVWQPPSCCIV